MSGWLRKQEKKVDIRKRDRAETVRGRRTSLLTEKGERLVDKRDRKLGKVRARFERKMEKASDEKKGRLASKLESKESKISNKFGQLASKFMVKAQKKA